MTSSRSLAAALSAGAAILALSALPLAPASAAPASGPSAAQLKQGHQAANTQKSSGATGKAATVDETTDRLIVKFRDGVPEEAKQRALSSRDASYHRVKKTAGHADVVALPHEMGHDDSRKASEALAADPSVVYAEPDQKIHQASAANPGTTPNDPYFSKQWALQDIGAPEAWNGATGDGVTIGVVDTGITDHPDLNDKIVPGYDFVSDPETARDGDARDDNPTDEGDWADGGTSNWHGTHVAGIAAASSGNGEGVAGTAPDARIQPARALGAGADGYVSDIADAVSWSSGQSVAGVPDNQNPSDVVNLSASWPSGTCPSVLKDAVDGAHAKNVPVVVASGNDGIDAGSAAPANCLGAVVVGATSTDRAMTGYSNYGPMLDVLAPGGSEGADIWSTMNDGATTPGAATYGTLNGTSMASPYVAGTIAMMKQRNPGLGVEDIRSILQSTGSANGDYVQMNAAAAVAGSA